jgi:WD40 repeat protein
MLATAENGEFIHVWNATSGKLEHSLHTRWGRSNVYSLAFGGEGRRLASGAYGAAVTLWDTQTGEEVVELPTHYMGVTAIAFSEDGWKLAAIINDGSVAVWDATPWLKHEDFH